MRSGRMPNWIHHFAKGLITPRANGSQRGGVIRSNRRGQPVFAKAPLQPRAHLFIGVMGQGLTQQQVAGEVITQRQRVAAVAVAQPKVPFEVHTPDLIRSGTLAKRFGVGGACGGDAPEVAPTRLV